MSEIKAETLKESVCFKQCSYWKAKPPLKNPPLKPFHRWKLGATTFGKAQNQQSNKHANLAATIGQVCIGVKKHFSLSFYITTTVTESRTPLRRDQRVSPLSRTRDHPKQVIYYVIYCLQTCLDNSSYNLICLNHTESLSIQVPHQQRRMLALKDLWFTVFVYTVYETISNRVDITLNIEDGVTALIQTYESLCQVSRLCLNVSVF